MAEYSSTINQIMPLFEYLERVFGCRSNPFFPTGERFKFRADASGFPPSLDTDSLKTDPLEKVLRFELSILIRLVNMEDFEYRGIKVTGDCLMHPCSFGLVHLGNQLPMSIHGQQQYVYHHLSHATSVARLPVGLLTTIFSLIDA